MSRNVEDTVRIGITITEEGLHTMKRLWHILGLLLLTLLLVPGMVFAGSFATVSTIHLPTDTASDDVMVADSASRLLYVADRTNAAVDVINMDTNILVKQITGFAGLKKKANGKDDNAHSGPNGLDLIGNELWVGDAAGKVQVVDLTAGKIVATVDVGGGTRADESAYDSKDGLLFIASPDEDVPFFTAISVKDRKVVGKIVFDKSLDGLEASRYNPATGLVYVNVPETKDNEGGETDVIDPKTLKVTAVFPAPGCQPKGLAIGPNNQLALGCGSKSINAGKAFSLILDGNNGKVLYTIPEFAGSDLVVYDATANQYYFAAREMTSDGTKAGKPNPVLGIVDAATGKTVAVVPTGKNGHAVAVDAKTGNAYVPIDGKGILVINKALPNTGTGTGTLALAGGVLLAGGLLLSLKRKARQA